MMTASVFVPDKYGVVHEAYNSIEVLNGHRMVGDLCGYCHMPRVDAHREACVGEFDPQEWLDDIVGMVECYIEQQDAWDALDVREHPLEELVGCD